MSQLTWDQYDGYKHSNQVSKKLRESLRSKAKFRQLTTLQNGVDTSTPLHAGDTFYWNVFSAPTRRNRRLNETQRIQTSSISQTQNSLTVLEFGDAIEITAKAELLSLQDWDAIINSGLAYSAASQFDVETFLQFKETPLQASPTSGTSADSVVFTENGTPSTTNDVALGIGHVKAIASYMKKRNIPPVMSNGDDCFYCIAGVDTLDQLRDDLEDIHKYTETGLSFIKFGEIGRYRDVKFIEQTMIPEGGAADSATYDPYTDTADAWDNGKSSWAMFFGDDPVTEAVVVPEEVRAKVAEDYGRDKGTAWYALEGFGITHPDADNARIVMWNSAA